MWACECVWLCVHVGVFTRSSSHTCTYGSQSSTSDAVFFFLYSLYLFWFWRMNMELEHPRHELCNWAITLSLFLEIGSLIKLTGHQFSSAVGTAMSSFHTGDRVQTRVAIHSCTRGILAIKASPQLRKHFLKYIKNNLLKVSSISSMHPQLTGLIC